MKYLRIDDCMKCAQRGVYWGFVIDQENGEVILILVPFEHLLQAGTSLTKYTQEYQGTPRIILGKSQDFLGSISVLR